MVKFFDDKMTIAFTSKYVFMDKNDSLWLPIYLYVT